MAWKTFLIDDDTISTLLTKHTLKRHHFLGDIATFHEAEEALSLLQDHTQEVPAVILLDLNMPVVSGWDFLEALGPHQARLQGGCKIFILTSSLDQADRIKSQEYPLVAGFFQKPLRPADIDFIRAEMRKQALN